MAEKRGLAGKRVKATLQRPSNSPPFVLLLLLESRRLNRPRINAQALFLRGVGVCGLRQGFA